MIHPHQDDISVWPEWNSSKALKSPSFHHTSSIGHSNSNEIHRCEATKTLMPKEAQTKKVGTFMSFILHASFVDDSGGHRNAPCYVKLKQTT